MRSTYKRPYRFTIEIDKAFSPGTQYLLHHNHLEVQYRGREQRLASPTQMQWSGFWRLCEFLDLWNWLPEYNEHNTRDGQSWKINIAFDKSKQIQSSGFNAYPSLEDAKRSSDTMDRFSLLLHFIDITLLSPRVDERDDFAEYLKDE